LTGAAAMVVSGCQPPRPTTADKRRAQAKPRDRLDGPNLRRPWQPGRAAGPRARIGRPVCDCATARRGGHDPGAGLPGRPAPTSGQP